MQSLDECALDQLFRIARTYQDWQDIPVSDDSLRSRVVQMGADVGQHEPRSLRVGAKFGRQARLAAEAAEMNRPKILASSWARSGLRRHASAPGNARAGCKAAELLRPTGITESTAMRNSTLQAAYLIIAARALGLNCGPMSGFSHEGVDAAFFKRQAGSLKPHL